MRERERGAKERERRRAGNTPVDFSILSSALAYVKSSLGSMRMLFFKLF